MNLLGSKIIYKNKMVLKIIAQLMARHGATVFRSVTEAYKRVTAGSRGIIL